MPILTKLGSHVTCNLGKVLGCNKNNVKATKIGVKYIIEMSVKATSVPLTCEWGWECVKIDKKIIFNSISFSV